MAKTSFKQFDIISDHSDHYYNNGSDEHSGFMNGSRAYKNIMREWKILKENLPDSIYVRAYEKRVDLMRAVIIGAADTPYQDGLFFFDIMFPPDYPDHPPRVHYRSHGLSLNPIIKVNGSICLSLLNTWIGWRSERWDSSRSTILQVLVSLQALVLDERPYYNHHELRLVSLFSFGILDMIPYSFFGHRDPTLDYNAEVFVSSCKSMLYLLKDPPRNFESFITQHFRQRANGILRASCSLKGCSSIKLVYPEIVQTFRNNGWVGEEEELMELADQEEWRIPWLICCVIFLLVTLMHIIVVIVGRTLMY